MGQLVDMIKSCCKLFLTNIDMAHMYKLKLANGCLTFLFSEIQSDSIWKLKALMSLELSWSLSLGLQSLIFICSKVKTALIENVLLCFYAQRIIVWF